MRDLRLDVARCIMNYMIVVLHAWAGFQYVPQNTVEFGCCTFVCSYLCGLAMPTFFLISGYLFFSNFSIQKLPKKLMNRVRRLVVPYIVWNATFVVFYLSLAHFVPRLGARVATYGLDTFPGAFSKILSFSSSPIDGPLWFLRTVFYLSLATPVLWPLMKLWKGKVVVALSMTWCVLESLLGLTESLHFIAPAYAIACFLIAGCVAVNGSNLVEEFKPWGWIVLGSVALSVHATAGIVTMMMHIPRGHAVELVMSVCSVLEAPALISLVSRMPVEIIAQNRVYKYLKEMSFFAYAGHFLFCSMLLHALAPFLAFMTTGKFTVLILIFVGLGVPLMSGVYWAACRLCPKALKLWDGTL